jgi:hypothetical protein
MCRQALSPGPILIASDTALDSNAVETQRIDAGGCMMRKDAPFLAHALLCRAHIAL